MDNSTLKKFRIHILVLFVASLLGTSNAWAGGDRQDFVSSVDFTLSKRFFKRLDLGLTESLSLKNNSSSIDKISTKADVSYNVVKGVFKVGVDYSIAGKANKEQDLYLNHRFSGYARLKKDVSRFTFGLKTKCQISYRPEKEPAKEFKHYWRNKLYFTAKLPKVALYPLASAECFLRTNDFKGNNTIEKMRYEAGLKYEFNKHNALQAKFRYDDAMHVVDPLDRFGVVVSYMLSL